MTAKQRILALKLLERQKHHPNFAKKIGIEVNIKTIAKRKGSCFAAVWLSIVIFPW